MSEYVTHLPVSRSVPGSVGRRGATGPSPVVVQGVAITPLSFEQAVSRVCAAAEQTGAFMVVTPNLAHLSRLRRDPQMRRWYACADLALADGWPVVRLLRAHGALHAERIAGSDLLPAVCAAAARRGRSVGFIGGDGDAALLAAERLVDASPGLRVTLIDPATPGFNRDAACFAAWLAALPAQWPDVLFVGLSEPAQSRVVAALAADPRARVVVGVGKSIEFAAGTARRAPEWAQRHGVEWLHRAVSEPRRLGPRYLRCLADLLPIALEELRSARQGGQVIDLSAQRAQRQEHALGRARPVELAGLTKPLLGEPGARLVAGRKGA